MQWKMANPEKWIKHFASLTLQLHQLHSFTWHPGLFLEGCCEIHFFRITGENDARCKPTCIATFKPCNLAMGKSLVSVANIDLKPCIFAMVVPWPKSILTISRFGTSESVFLVSVTSELRWRLQISTSFRLERSVPIENWLVFFY